MPLGPGDSLPVTILQPSFGCHSHTSPLFAPFWSAAATALPPRAAKLVVTKPPPGNGLTELRPCMPGTTAHPIHVTTGGLALPSISNTSIDSRLPWWTTYKVCTPPFPGRRFSPCALIFLSVVSIGPGQVP